MSGWKPDIEVNATFKDDGREEELIEITNEDASETYCYATGMAVARAICLAMNNRNRLRKLEQDLLHTQAMMAADRDGLTYDHPIHGTIKTIEEFKYLVIDPLAGNDQQVLEQKNTLPKMMLDLERPAEYWERVVRFVEDYHKVCIGRWLPEMDEDVDRSDMEVQAKGLCNQAVFIAEQVYGLLIRSPYGEDDDA